MSDVIVAGGLLLYTSGGRRRQIEESFLREAVKDGPSWLRYTLGMLTGRPAMMLIDMGSGKTEKVFVTRALRQDPADTYQTLLAENQDER